MNKVLLITVSVLLVVICACKKGENDNSLSLSSRTKRLASEWELIKMESTEMFTIIDINTNEESTAISNLLHINGSGELIFSYKYENGSYALDTIVPFKDIIKPMIFDKVGTYSNLFLGISYTFKLSEESTYWNWTELPSNSGKWSFLNKDEDLGIKDKEAISLSGGSQMCLIDKLTNKELILIYEDSLLSGNYNLKRTFYCEKVK